MRKHKPTAGMEAILILTSSDACPDMRNVVSAAFVLQNSNGDVATLPGAATLGTATASAVRARRAWDVASGEAQQLGSYVLWALATLNDRRTVKIAHNPISFMIVDDSQPVD
jgi:hypothetical protein